MTKSDPRLPFAELRNLVMAGALIVWHKGICECQIDLD